ncbi:DUF982 domain-containing protein [Shinella curvata]|uniref:DUF982 domain-containing protein n=1 Tax=Shinella curvata TaxID=1817964 RepID=A0ABT8XES7_9HYPH|nr:DUF982 domain-containing protein [Shinella curvata]MCJ8052933.1 DUF982 domain-containing protein [Shinella curvata]MDO6122264.1 DUF982 domain-containing protein [Shinella curvata]
MTIYATDRLWDEAVVLEAKGRVLRVQSTRDALLCLKNHWPTENGPAMRTAISVGEQGLTSDDDPAFARRAFIEAAREAGFSVNAWTVA